MKTYISVVACAVYRGKRVNEAKQTIHKIQGFILWCCKSAVGKISNVKVVIKCKYSKKNRQHVLEIKKKIFDIYGDKPSSSLVMMNER